MAPDAVITWTRNRMKLVIPGGTGQVGRVLVRAFRARGHQVVVLSRKEISDPGVVQWDGRTVGPWVGEIDGADAVINLAGRSVNCRYTRANLQEMMDSRVESTRAVGLAIQNAGCPPRTWLQMSTATIYAHRFDADNDELTGRIGGDEPEAPSYWRYSIDIARAWERVLCEARDTGHPQGSASECNVDEPKPRRHFQHTSRSDPARSGWPHCRRSPVRLLDP